ncbi:hypothetical protein CLV30_12153 [Haloactinopolyspora alba]|uniref:3-hydroxyacyl-CoA dehydrogenase n=1 Tax=Haloactinopolyspora alba TaxID=648780 RepID=A0A2P8DL04_9ACTN|nr:Rv3235 family protein [Haloactinopolyspora alba]PSK97896.1 hypothetical protein CLV30_12153 [Haloactinopolyspora alba]
MADSTSPRRPGGIGTTPAVVRRLPLPATQPPYDDEPAGAARQPDGTGTTAGTGDPPRRSSTRAAPPATDGALALSPAVSRGTGELPDPRRWVAKLTQAALEGIHGHRSLQQLVRWTDEPVHQALTRRAQAVRVRSVVRPRIRAVRLCRVEAAIAESAAVVQLGTRTLAVAVRLEAVHGRWLCTAFEPVETGPARLSR